MKYRKKPCEIEAVRWTGINLEEIKAFVGDSLIYDILDTAWQVGKGRPHVLMKIRTLEGDMNVSEGDYIIKGVEGEFYPCKPDIFAKTYELASDDDYQLTIDEINYQIKQCMKTIEKCKNLLSIIKYDADGADSIDALLFINRSIINKLQKKKEIIENVHK